MHFYVLLSLLAVSLGVYGDQFDSRFLKVRSDISGLHERQTDTCDTGYFACTGADAGGCCPIGSNCTTNNECAGPLETCTDAGQQICGTFCCNSPLICSESTLTCVNGGSAPAPAPAPAPVPVPAPAPVQGPAPAPAPVDPCASQCAWTANSDSCTTLTCDCQVLENAGQAAFSSCVNCAAQTNVTYENLLLSVASACGFSPTSTTSKSPSSPSSTVACESQCAWTEGAESCTDLQCDCQVIQLAGQAAFSSCLNCAEGSNVTYANILISISEQCQIVSTTSSSTRTFNTLTQTTATKPPVTIHTAATSATSSTSTHTSGAKKDGFNDGMVSVTYFIIALLAILAGSFSLL